MSYSGSEDLMVMLDKRSLLGFQLDASHLHDMLEALIRNQSQHAQSTDRRIGAIESAIQDLDLRMGRIDQFMGTLGDGMPSVKDQITKLMQDMDSLHRLAIPDLRQRIDENRHLINESERSVQQLDSAMRPIVQFHQQSGQSLEGLSRELAQLGREQMEQGKALQTQYNSLRDAGSRMDILEKDIAGLGVQLQRGTGGIDEARFRSAFDEINSRMNENFRLVEQGANAVDIELGKLRTDLANLRAEVNTLDNNTRYKMGKITDDVDEKFNMLLDTLRLFESNTTKMEEAISTAGKALAQQRTIRQMAMAQTTSSNYYSGSQQATGSVPRRTY